MKIPKNNKRSLQFRKDDIDSKNRTVTLSFSSETPVRRYYGDEILGHKENEVDMSRLNNYTAVLEDHQGPQVGVVERAWLEDGKGYAELKFSSVGRGAEIWQDIEDGIRKNVSVGYEVRKMDLEKEDGENSVYRVSDWMPFEISIVGVPADVNVGVGRSSDEKEVPFIDVEERSKEPNKINDIKLNVKVKLK